MTAGFWRLFAALVVATIVCLGAAWCTTACNGAPVMSPSEIAEKNCIDDAEAGVGRAALKKSIDDCRAVARDGGR